MCRQTLRRIDEGAGALDGFTRLLDGEKCVCDLTDALETGQSRLSYHLKVLKDAGLVTDRREGRWSYYTLARDAFLETEELLTSLRPRASRALKVKCC